MTLPPGTPGIDFRQCCCYKFLWNIFNAWPQGPTSFLSRVGLTSGVGGWDSPSLYPRYSGSGLSVRIADADAIPAASEVIFYNIPDQSLARWYVNVPAGSSTSGDFAEVLTSSTGSAHVAITTAGVTTINEVTSLITGSLYSNFSVGIFKQPTCDQWMLFLIWNPQPVGPNTCPSFFGTESAPVGGALIPTIVTDDGTGNSNDLTNDVGGVNKLASFPTCGMDDCSSMWALPMSGKPTHTGMALYLQGTLPIALAGLGVASAKPGGFWRSNADAFDKSDYCIGYPQDSGLADCDVYITITGINFTGTAVCNWSIVNGMHKFSSVKGIMNGQAAGATSVHIVNLGSLYVGNAGSDCCFVLTLTTTYDRSTGYTSLSLGFVYTGSTKSGPSPCPGASDPVSATIAYHSDNVGHASIAGGRKTNNEFVGIGLTSAAGTVGDWDFSGVTVVINGTDPSACAPQTCTGPTPPTPPTCSKYAVYICCFNISTNTYTVKVNGTTIGTFTTSGSQNPSHVEVFATASGITYDVLFDSGDPCGTSSTHGPSTINNSVISSPFTSGANTIEIDVVGVDDEGVDEFLVQVLKTTSAGVICDTLLSNGSDFPDSSSTQLFAFPFYA